MVFEGENIRITTMYKSSSYQTRTLDMKQGRSLYDIKIHIISKRGKQFLHMQHDIKYFLYSRTYRNCLTVLRGPRALCNWMRQIWSVCCSKLASVWKEKANMIFGQIKPNLFVDIQSCIVYRRVPFARKIYLSQKCLLQIFTLITWNYRFMSWFKFESFIV